MWNDIIDTNEPNQIVLIKKKCLLKQNKKHVCFIFCDTTSNIFQHPYKGKGLVF